MHEHVLSVKYFFWYIAYFLKDYMFVKIYPPIATRGHVTSIGLKTLMMIEGLRESKTKENRARID